CRRTLSRRLPSAGERRNALRAALRADQQWTARQSHRYLCHARELHRGRSGAGGDAKHGGGDGGAIDGDSRAAKQDPQEHRAHHAAARAGMDVAEQHSRAAADNALGFAMILSPVWRLVPALGITQIISWGSLYYAIAVLGASMRAELGLSSPA